MHYLCFLEGLKELQLSTSALPLSCSQPPGTKQYFSARICHAHNGNMTFKLPFTYSTFPLASMYQRTPTRMWLPEHYSHDWWTIHSKINWDKYTTETLRASVCL